MKKTVRILSLVCILLVLFSSIAYAAPAPPVSSVRIVDAYIGTDGNVYIAVQVAGYGQPNAWWDGSFINDYDIQTIGKPTVTGFYYTYNCGPAVSGSHSFQFRITSFNSPGNTMSVSGTFTIG